MEEHKSYVFGGVPWDWDTEAGILTQFGMPSITMWLQPSLERMLGPLRDEVSPDLFHLLVAHASSQGADEDYRTIVMAQDMSFEEGFAAWSDAVAANGWGRFRLLEYNKDQRTALIRVDNPWELQLSTPGTKWGCAFIQGKIIGLFSLVFGVTCWAHERSFHDADNCFVEFSVAPSTKTIELELNRMRQAQMQRKEQALTREVSLKTAHLLAAEEEQRAILTSLSDLVVAIDSNGVIEQYILPADEQVSFPSKDGAVNKPVWSVFGKLFINVCEQARANFPSAYSVQFDLYVDEATRYYDARATARQRPDGTLGGMTLVVRDVSEQQRLAEALSQRERMETLGQLAGGIAHDFNNVLAAVMGAAELLKINLPEKQHALVDTILDASGSAAGLVQGMLSFSRRGQEKSVVLDLHDIVRRAFELLERSIDRRISFELHLNAEFSLFRGDASQIQSAMLNLGINARDSMSAGGKIFVRSRTQRFDQPTDIMKGALPLPAGQYIVLSVEDTGKGMDEVTIARIFEPFFSTKAPGAGTGLGLVGVERTISDHGGRLSVRSNPLSGSEFTLYFPLDRDLESAQAVTDIIANQVSNAGQPRILLVDDDLHLRELGEQLLQLLGYQVMLAVDGADALRQVQSSADAIDMIILDLNMPVLDGIDTRSRLKILAPDLPVLMSTGSMESEAFLSDGQPVLRKPYRVDDLVSAITKVLDASGPSSALSLASPDCLRGAEY